VLDLFMAHPFVNSAGARYLPRSGPEDVLVEDFAEGKAPGSPLLEALSLPRRTRLCRLEVEAALLRAGPDVVAALGLDARDFRVLCIPFDLYCRLGATRGWGRQEQVWTHFDGYQVWKARALRALVGGDARFGGLHHVCSITPDDERDEVIARFAVVRRQRLALRRDTLEGGDGEAS
jgi:hypothetical protein